MNEQAQRITIHKGCGGTTFWSYALPTPHVHESVPDYLNDLNAMHEAEKGMKNQQWWKFVDHLTDICGGGTALGISATAAQRSEAFLRAIDKWEE